MDDVAAPSSAIGGPKTRTSRDAVLNRQVRWRLFRTEEMPARLRRLERLERVAEQAPGREGVPQGLAP